MARTLPPRTFCQPGAQPPKSLANYAGLDGQSGLDLPQRRKLRVQAAQFINQAGAGTARTVLFFARNPSPRLRWSITAGFELDPAANFVPFTVGTGPTWQIRATRQPEVGGSPADLNDLFTNTAGTPTARAIPDGYELDSAVEYVRGTLNLFDGAGRNLDSGQFGNLVLEGLWQPHDGYVNRSEIAQLLTQVELYVIGIAPQLANGT